jgi:hypothetical protein
LEKGSVSSSRVSDLLWCNGTFYFDGLYRNPPSSLALVWSIEGDIYKRINEGYIEFQYSSKLPSVHILLTFLRSFQLSQSLVPPYTLNPKSKMSGKQNEIDGEL